MRGQRRWGKCGHPVTATLSAKEKSEEYFATVLCDIFSCPGSPQYEIDSSSSILRNTAIYYTFLSASSIFVLFSQRMPPPDFHRWCTCPLIPLVSVRNRENRPPSMIPSARGQEQSSIYDASSFTLFLLRTTLFRTGNRQSRRQAPCCSPGIASCRLQRQIRSFVGRLPFFYEHLGPSQSEEIIGAVAAWLTGW